MAHRNIIVVYLLCINIVAAAFYGLDKWKAKKNRWRIPESTLLFIAALGGSAGALLAMRLFHHKTRHRKFTITIPIFLILQTGLLVWFLQHQ